jgi:hypothetical protein
MTKKLKAPKLKTHKLGANRNELAIKKKKIKPHHSRDIREDRGTRQTKMGRRK